jgi:anti-sigma B factor antagonist
LGAEDLAVRKGLQNLLDAGQYKVILNLKEVSDIDSTGLGTLVYWGLRLREGGGKLVLLNLSEFQARLPEALKLNAAFETYQDENDAVNSFFPERAAPHYDILDFVEEQERKG